MHRLLPWLLLTLPAATLAGKKGVVEDLGVLRPAAFTSGPVDLDAARALAKTLAATLSGDKKASKQLAEQASALDAGA